MVRNEANRLLPAECRDYSGGLAFLEKRSSFFLYESTALKHYALQWQQSLLMISGVYDFSINSDDLLS